MLYNEVHKFSNLKQHTFIILQFLWGRSLSEVELGPLLRVS